MLKIEIPPQELWDELKNEFTTFDGISIALEHSLVSISKWESIYHKPFLSNNNKKSLDELRTYIKCMTITQNVPDEAYLFLSQENWNKINEYIDNPMTATTVNDVNKGKRNKLITSEVIYYWMIKCGIPFRCEKWHLNRLLMLIRVCNAFENEASGKKMPKRDLLSRNAALNNARKKQLNTRG